MAQYAMDSTELCYTPATTLAAWIRERRLSPVELTDAVIARIEAINPRINAYCTVAAELARQAAARAEQLLMRGEHLGPLHGIPIAIKDLTLTAGIRTTFGSKVFENNIPSADAAVVTRITQAGGIVVGKTNTPEFGAKAVTDNLLFGPTRNPWDLERTPGGSSGGAAAALAAGLAPLAQGGDGGGSIRIPAAACGVVGLKPTPGRISRFPAVDGWNSLSVLGPMARTVADTALLFSVMCGYDGRDPISLPGAGGEFAKTTLLNRAPAWRVAWTVDFGYATIDRRVADMVEEAVRVFSELGCRVEHVNAEFGNPESLFRRLTGPVWAETIRPLLPQWADQIDPILLRRARAGAFSAQEYIRLLNERTQLWEAIQRLFERFDLLITPALAVLPFAIESPYPPMEVAGQAAASPLAWMPFTFPFNLTGHAAIVVPAGWTSDGLPVGVQIVGPRLAESRLLNAAALFEAARPWAHRRPLLQ